VGMLATLGNVVGKIPRPTPAMVVALVALLIACSGAAFAAIPSSSGTITACYTATGSLRVIDPEAGQACRSAETQLSWKDGITGKVADSNLLDGKDSSHFARASLFGSPVNARNGENANSDCVIGEVRLFAGSVTPGGWKMAHGQVLPINEDNNALYSLLGTKYGGNGETTFALPDLRGAEPNGAGAAAPNYAICTQGIYPH
jgi:hypothetical protein